MVNVAEKRYTVIHKGLFVHFFVTVLLKCRRVSRVGDDMGVVRINGLGFG